MHWNQADIVHIMKLAVSRGVARGEGAMPPNRRLSGFFNGKNWLCWDVVPALFSKVM